MKTLWSSGITGQGVDVANMDTGVDYLHPDLHDRWRGLVPGFETTSWFDPNGQHTATPFDKADPPGSPNASGHGTGTMGIMVGEDYGGTAIGVAPDAKWIAVKIFNDKGDAFLSAIVDGFQWLLDPDNNPDTDDAPDVVNNSWEYDAPNRCINSGAYAVLRTSIQNLKAAGIAVVFSAGNSGPYASTERVDVFSDATIPQAYGYPIHPCARLSNTPFAGNDRPSHRGVHFFENSRKRLHFALSAFIIGGIAV